MKVKTRKLFSLLVSLVILAAMLPIGQPLSVLASPDEYVVSIMAGANYSADLLFDGEKASFQAEYKNGSDARIQGYFYLGIYYQNGRMAYAESKPLDAPAGGSAKAVFDVDADKYPLKDYKVKVFYWDLDYIPLKTESYVEPNAALRRATFQSSAVDEFNTATLITDGIVSEPQERSFADGPWTSITRYYREWIYVDLGAPTAITQVAVTWGASYATRYRVQVSSDGFNWTTTNVIKGSNTYSGGGSGGANPLGVPTATWANARQSDNVTGGVNARYVRILCESCSGGAEGGTYVIRGVEVNNAAIDKYYALDGFDSYWQTKAGGEQWAYVDLGAETAITGASVVWGGNYATDYAIQTSNDASNWTTAINADGSSEELRFVANARYARLLMRASSGPNYIVKEFEVYGKNDIEYKLEPMPAPEADGTQYLRGGNWKLERASQVAPDAAINVRATGIKLSQPGYNDSRWLPATVPSTTLASYINAGAVPDPYYDFNNVTISDTYFTSDFWYRNSFEIPAEKEGQDVWLNFDAVNYRADVFFNGHFLPNALTTRVRSIEGGFIRGKFDVTPYVNFGGENYLAVFVQMNDTPWCYTSSTSGETNNVGAATYVQTYITKYVTNQYLNAGPWPNGGNIGIDNPTFHAAAGWDWMPTIRGRDTGIYRDVFLSYTGGVEMLDPWMVTDLDITLGDGDYSSVNQMTYTVSGVTQPTGENGAGLTNIFDRNLTTEWLGDANAANPSFTAQFSAAITVNTIVINWGEVLPNRAYESQNAAKFKVEVSDDGVAWRNYDSYPAGGTGANAYPASDGTASYEGGNITSTIMGPTNPISGAIISRSFRYLRFTTLEKMVSVNSDQGILPPKITEMQFYSQQKSALDQSGVAQYDLDASKAALTFKTEVKNNTSAEVQAQIDGVINPGGLPFSKTVSVPANSTVAVAIDDIVMNNPALWWPNTYGDQPLYTAKAELKIGGAAADVKEFKFGVREFTYNLSSGAANRLGIYCNGTFILAKGGNWGMDDALQMDTPQRYDDKVRLHAEENMTMIRNWVGQTYNKAFYDACDKYGIMIWDDFWLANPYDGTNPKDIAMFNENAIDRIKVSRSHPSLTVYCGRNESNPPSALMTSLAANTNTYDGTRYYFNNSAGAPVGSGGGYQLASYTATGTAQGPKQYFANVTANTLRSERGIPNVPTIQTIQKFVAPENQWPISEVWAHHDWTYMMNGPANSYMNALKSYMPKITWTFPNSPGGNQNQDPETTTMINYRNQYTPMLQQLAQWYTLEEFSTVAQMINYENHKALYQALTTARANGLLMWMSQSSWPSFMWQTYDYYLDTNGGYFGVKAGNQPTQPVWDPRDNRVVLSNFTTKDYSNVKTELTIYNLNGVEKATAEYTTPLLKSNAYNILVDTITSKFAASDTDMIFIKLVLKTDDGEILGENMYWHNKTTYVANQALTTLAKAKLTASKSAAETLPNGNIQYTLSLANNDKVPAVQTRIRTLSSATGGDVLPVFYSDNYFILMPGDSKTVTAEFDPKNLEGDPIFTLSGWNTVEESISAVTPVVPTVKMVNENSTPETKSLFNYLKNMPDKIMFGHQTDETGLVTGTGGGSDTVRAVGDRPSVLATSVLTSVSGIRDAYNRGQVISVEHHTTVQAGFGAGYGNTTTGDMAWGYRLMPGQAYHANLVTYLRSVANWAKTLTVSATDSTLIPVIYRPWHEHNGDWFWWNTPNTTEGEMREIFRFTVEYLRDVEGVTNFIYAFSPNGHFDSEEEYLYAYPGDEYIDLLGIDIYWDVPESNPDWFDLMIRDCQIAVNYANKTGKAAALTECGLRWDTKDGFEPLGTYEGNGRAKGVAELETRKLSEEQRTFYTTMANRILNDKVASQIAYMSVWRQGTDSNNLHFWVPFSDYTAPTSIQPTDRRGYLGDHQALSDFQEYYANPGVLFLSDTASDPKYKTPVEAVHNLSYVNIKAPVKDEVLIANPPAPNPAYSIPNADPRPSNPGQGKYRALVYPALLAADETVQSVVIKFANQTLNATQGADFRGATDSANPKYWYADLDITADAVADGRYTISVAVTLSNGRVLTESHSVKVKNQPAPAKDPYVVDDFDSYDPTDDNRSDLERVWFRDSGCMVGLRLREAGKGDAAGFGVGNVLRLKYDTCRKGSSSTGTITPHTNNIYWSGFYRTYSPAVNWSAVKKLSVVVQSDGKPHNLAFMITSGTRVYQAYASDSEIPYDRSLTTPQTLQIDISKFRLMNASGFGVSVPTTDLASISRFSVRMESDPGDNFAGLNASEFYLFDNIRWITELPSAD